MQKIACQELPNNATNRQIKLFIMKVKLHNSLLQAW